MLRALLVDSFWPDLACPQAELERLATSLGCTQTALLQDTTHYTPCYTLSHCGSVVRNLCDQAAEIDASVVAELPEDAASRIVVNYRLILPVGGRYQLLVFAVRHCCCYQCAKTQVAAARCTVACFGGHAWSGGHGDLVTGRLPFESSVSCMHVSEGYHEGGCSRLHMDWL